MRAAAKMLLVNLLVAGGLLLALELGYRTFKFAASCMNSSCERSYWSVRNKFAQNVSMGLTLDHRTLGYVPNDGQFELPGPLHKTVSVTIRDGVRTNGSELPYSLEPSTLAIGDSFTFGSEVSNRETWPACLERRWNTRVVNGGVFGYGAAQAVLRAREMEKEHRYDRIIWSILLGLDFERDRLVARGDVLRPAVVSDERGMRYTEIKESRDIFERTSSTPFTKHAYVFGYSYTTKLAWQRAGRLFLPPGTRYDGRWDVAHPRAAATGDIMRFAFDQFASLRAREKYVLLQYAKNDLSTLSTQATAELDGIKALAAARGMPIIDSRPALQAAIDTGSLYVTHHTPAGNDVVCRAIVAAIPVTAVSEQVTQAASAQDENKTTAVMRPERTL